MSLFSSLSSASNTLSVFENALSIAQNNVANASTPGYVKQTARFESRVFDPGIEPGGVDLGPVESARNSYADANVRDLTSQAGFYEQRVNDLSPINNQFDISGNSGISADMNSLFTAFSDWAATPNDTTARQAVISHASSLAATFRSTMSNFGQIARNSDTQTTSLVSQANDLASQIATYNQQISASGQVDPGTDAAINSTLEQLSQIARVMMIKQPNGTFSVFLGGQTQLVSGSTVNKLTAAVYIPTRPTASSGHAISVPITFTAGQNDKLNLKVDGNKLPQISLAGTYNTMDDVAAEINRQLAAAGSTATASAVSEGSAIPPTAQTLVIKSAGKVANPSVEVLPGGADSANTTLGLSVAGPPQAHIIDASGADLTSEITSGSLGASLEQRNQLLPQLQGDYTQTGDFNRMAKAFADRVNSLIGVPLFTYDQTNATQTAATLTVNPNITVNQLPSPRVVSLTGVAPASSGSAAPVSNASLNLKIDGVAVPSIALNTNDKSLTDVASDLTSQFATLGIGASAIVDASGALQLQSNQYPSGSVEVLSGTANAVLGLSVSGAPAATVTGTPIPGTIAVPAPTPSLSIAPVSTSLNLKIDGAAIPSIALNTADRSLSDVANDLNSQFTSLGVGATASFDSTTNRLSIQSNQGASGTVEVLAGSANSLIGLGVTPPTSGQISSAPVTTPIYVPASNSWLNLTVDGSPVKIALDPNDKSMADVRDDLNRQFGLFAGVNAKASLDSSGALNIDATSGNPTSSVQLLSGTANSLLGFANPTPTYKNDAANVALSLAGLANPSSSADMLDGKSFTSFFGSIVSNVGGQLSTAKNAQTSNSDLLTQAQALRQQLSGVDLNEEATRVLQLQASYQAASKFFKAIDDMTQTIMSMLD